MARILIREDVVVLERLLATIATRAGHQCVSLGAEVDDVHGDLLLLDPDSTGALEWVDALRRRQPSIPVVSIGTGQAHANGIRPTAIVEKPFRVGALERAIDNALRFRGGPLH